MTEQMPDLGISKATSGVKASFERLMAWAKKNPALVVAALAGVVILVLIAKRRQPTERVARSSKDESDPFGGVGMGDGVPEVPPGDIIFPELPSIPPVPAPTIPTTPSNGASQSTTTYVQAYTPPSPMLTEMQKMGIDIVRKIRDDPNIPSNIGDIFASNYRKAEMLAKREEARITARERKTKGDLAAAILARRSDTTPSTDRTRPGAKARATRRRFKATDSSRDKARRRKRAGPSYA